MPISEDRADGIEKKIDELRDAVGKLILIDERQIQQGKRLGETEDKVAKLEATAQANKEALNAKIDLVDKKLDKWINMGLGAWALLATIFTLYQTFSPLIHKGP